MHNVDFRQKAADCLRIRNVCSHAMIGRTSTEKKQSAVLPSSSVATHATFVVPTSKESPEAWLQITSTEASDVSEAVIVDQVAVAVEVAYAVSIAMSPGQLSNEGFAMSRMRIVNWQSEFTLPAASVAVQVTTVDDGVVNESPDKTEQTGVTVPSTESVAVGSVHVTTSLVPLVTYEK